MPVAMTTYQSSLPCKRTVIFSYHSIGFGNRKNSVIFLAEALARLGWKVDVVTAQLSLLSRLAGVPRLRQIPTSQCNRWLQQTDQISNFVWIPILHPATTPFKPLDRLATPLFHLYPYLLPHAVRERVREAQLVIIESCSAVLLFPLLKKLAPDARFVYRASDSLEAVDMHPMLGRAAIETAPDYDLFTSPSHRLLATFPAGINKCHVPQGLEKALFDASAPAPFPGSGPNAVVAGDMMFDLESFELMVKNFPGVKFHVFGRMKLEGFGTYANLVHHGEVPFETLVGHLLYADLGIAPYLDRPEVHYLAESSLKLIQYTYAQLPILAPYFCRGDLEHVRVYNPGNEGSIIKALNQALSVNRQTIDRSGVLDWNKVAVEMLTKLDLSA
jgi:2-beta-glucuronyltransferase